jgi:hypothetical protein
MEESICGQLWNVSKNELADHFPELGRTFLQLFVIFA